MADGYLLSCEIWAQAEEAGLGALPLLVLLLWPWESWKALVERNVTGDISGDRAEDGWGDCPSAGLGFLYPSTLCLALLLFHATHQTCLSCWGAKKLPKLWAGTVPSPPCAGLKYSHCPHPVVFGKSPGKPSLHESPNHGALQTSWALIICL